MRLKKRNQLIYTHYTKGLSQRKIGQLYGLSQSAISKIIITHQQEAMEEKGTAQEANFLVDLSMVQTLIREEFDVHCHQKYLLSRLQEVALYRTKE